MNVVFDPVKDLANQAKHGISLGRAIDLDLDVAVRVEDTRFAYGEQRFIAYGPIDGRIHCLVYTKRDGLIRAISLRRANNREITFYEQET